MSRLTVGGRRSYAGVVSYEGGEGYLKEKEEKKWFRESGEG